MRYQTFFKEAKKKNITNIQIAEVTKMNSQVSFINGQMEDYSDSTNVSYEIKAEYNGKTVKTNSNYLGVEILDNLLLKINLTDTNYQNTYLETRKNNSIKKKPNISIVDIMDRLKQLNSIKENYREIKTLQVSFSNQYEKRRIINSNGVDIATDNNLYTFYTEAVADRNNSPVSYNCQMIETLRKNINFEEIVEDTIEKAILSLNKEKLDSKKYNIILSNSVAGEILSHLIDMISMINIRNNMSCLNNKLNQKVFSDKLTIVEDPLNKKYPGYSIFDNEGTYTNKKILVERGILKEYLYNNQEATLKNRKSTGNGYGTIDTRNMYIPIGNKNLVNLFSTMKDGLYITNFMGSSNTSIDTSTGSISIQVFGFVLQDGKIQNSFEPAVLTTTIFELFNNLEEIGTDLEFVDTTAGSPSIYVKNISIAA